MMHPPGGGAHGRGDVFEESDDVVVGAFLDFEDLGDGEFRLFADSLGVGGGDLSETRHGLASEGLDLEPNFVFALVGPEGPHLGSGISVNHPRTLADHEKRTNPENKKGRKPPGPDPACHEKICRYAQTLTRFR